MVQEVRIVVSGDDRWILERVHDTYGPLAVEPATAFRAEVRVSVDHAVAHGGYDVRTGDAAAQPVHRSDRDAALLAVLDAIAAGLVRGLDALGALGIHAGAVAVRGRAIAIAGRSTAGKTTLVLELLRSGAQLLSDELALIAPDGRTVVPYARGLHVRPDTVALVPELGFLHDRRRHEIGGGSEWSVVPADLATALGTAVAEPAPLAGVLLLGRAPDPSRPPVITRIPAAIAAVELAAGTPIAAVDYGRTLERLSRIVGGVACARLDAGELRSTGRAVLGWLEALP